MHEDAIENLDRAALTLLRTLDRYGGELTPYLDESSLHTLRREVDNLRRALLGVQMGPLYWNVPPEVVDEVLHTGQLSVGDAVARVNQRLQQGE